MRAMILAAGKGERMLPLTHNVPKPLLMVNGRPLIEHHLLALAAAGIREVIINVWYLGEQLVAALGDGSRFGLKICYSVEEQLLNTGGGIVQALPLLGDDPFLVLSADILTDFPLKNLPAQPRGLAHLVLVNNPGYHEQGDFALRQDVVALHSEPKLTYANIGIYTHRFFVDAPHGAFPLGDLLRRHISNGQVSGEHYTGSWYNVGTPADLQLVNSLI